MAEDRVMHVHSARALALTLLLSGAAASEYELPLMAARVRLSTQYSVLGTHYSPLTAHHSLDLSAIQSGDQKDSEQTYLDALRERKLYRLLEAYCRRQLSRSDATAADRARYTIELANILSVRAQEQTQAAARAELWRQAATLLAEFLTENPRHAQAVTLRFQIGIYELLHGELLRQQAKLAPQDEALIEAARARLHAAADAFRTVDAEVTEAMNNRQPGDGSGGDPPSVKQLAALASNTRFRLGQALLAVAQTYPRHSADQTDAAAQAQTQFEAFTQRYNTSELTLESYLGIAECLRLLGDPAAALKSLGELEKPDTPEKYLDRALVLRAQLQLDQKKPAAARGFIDESRKLLKAPNPEMDLLYVQATLEVARQQSKEQGNLVARQLVGEALRAMSELEQTHGLFWGGRCDLLLAELAAENVLVEDPAVLVRMADGQFRRGDRPGAVATLDRAAKLARERGDTDQTVAVGFRAASIVVQAGEFEDAAERFARLASTYANHPRAGNAQFMAAHCLGQAYAADRTPERLAKYEQAMEQHVRAFGNDPSAAEARWLLGSLRIEQRRWSDAIPLLDAIPTAHKRFADARQEIGRAYEEWIRELWSRQQPAEKVVGEAIRFLRRALPSGNTALAAADVPLALRLARIVLHPTVARYDEAEPLLEQVLFGRAANESERSEARRLSVAALVGRDKLAAAARMIEAEFVGRPEELFAVVQSLEDAAGRSSETRRRQIGKLQLAATERLAREAEQLSKEQALQVEIYLALAYVNAGEASRADELFRKLRDRVPNNPRILEAQADCYMQLGRYAQARDLWRQLVGTVRENTPVWFRAKYNLALACFHTGDRQQCLKIIQVTALLHPDLGGPELKAKFEELKAKCQASEGR